MEFLAEIYHGFWKVKFAIETSSISVVKIGKEAKPSFVITARKINSKVLFIILINIYKITNLNKQTYA